MNIGNLIGEMNFSINMSDSKKRGYILIKKDNAIYKNDEIIDTQIKLKNHSPTGLTWGYNGSGPSQTALAILCDFTKDEKFSLEHYMEFKNDVIAILPDKDCLLKYSDIQKWVDLKSVEVKNG
jgi:hypothetical protein